METNINNKELVELLRKQYDHEINNYRIYANMAVYCSKLGLNGHVFYFEHRAHEEYDHASRVKAIMKDASLELLPGTLPAVAREFTDLEGMHKEVLELEEETTKLLNNLGTKALTAGYHHLYKALSWLINEQNEEEKVSRTALEIVRTGKDDDLTIDQQIGEIFK